jgi:hypothetical protein
MDDSFVHKGKHEVAGLGAIPSKLAQCVERSAVGIARNFLMQENPYYPLFGFSQ